MNISTKLAAIILTCLLLAITLTPACDDDETAAPAPTQTPTTTPTTTIEPTATAEATSTLAPTPGNSEATRWKYRAIYADQEDVFSLDLVGEETVDSIDCHVIEAIYDEPLTRVAATGNPLDVLSGKYWVSQSKLDEVKTEGSIKANKMIDLVSVVTATYATPDHGSPFAIGKKWKVDRLTHLEPQLLPDSTGTFSVEVVAQEDITVPAGAYSCFKLEFVATAKDGVPNENLTASKAEWWSIEENLPVAIKIEDYTTYDQTETRELVPADYTAETVGESTEAVAEIELPEKWMHLKSTESWLQFGEMMDSTMNTLLEEARDEIEVMDAYAIVLRALAVATEVTLDPNPDAPTFARMDTPARKVGGDNPDAEYDICSIDGRSSYRITGNKGTVSYLGFQVLGGTGMTPRYHVTYIKDEDFVVDKDGNFELILSANEPSCSGQWIKITEDSGGIVVRQYIGDRKTETLATYQIERIDAPPIQTEIDEEAFAQKLISTAFVMNKLATLYDDNPVLLDKPNQLTTLSSQQAGAGASDTTPDNTYMMGVYELEPDQVLIVDVQPPNTRYWNFTIYNIWFECIDYLHRPVSMTNNNVKLRSDNTARFIISHRKPDGLSEDVNWLDTAGRQRGFMVLRWLESPDVAEPKLELSTLDANF